MDFGIDASCDTDMDQLFEQLSREIADRSQHIAKLQQTLETFQQKRDLFDEKDVEVLSAVLAKRNEEYVKMNQDYTAAKELYTATVVDLEKRILKKEEILRQTDASFGSISAEDELRLHFAQKQTQLQQGLQRAKAQLCATIFERLKPSISISS